MRSPERRPELTPRLTGAELLRWYWTRDELAALARRMALPTGGGKQDLTARLAAALDGLPLPVEQPRRAGRHQLAEPLGNDTEIPAGQRCSQVLRAFFQREIGPAFHFDAFMRAFIAGGAGRTLGAAVQHWHATRETAAQPQEIGPQFELNRFLRDWHRRNPGGTHAQGMDAWRAHRAEPARVADQA